MVPIAKLNYLTYFLGNWAYFVENILRGKLLIIPLLIGSLVILYFLIVQVITFARIHKMQKEFMGKGFGRRVGELGIELLRIVSS